jgi:hypothetical protein
MNKRIAWALGLFLLPWAAREALSADNAPPVVTLTLCDRHGHVTPLRQGCVHTGSGIIDIVQPTPNVVVVTMMGAAVATAHPVKDSVAQQNFDLEQCFSISTDKPAPCPLKLTVEGRVVGLLRTHKGSGTAEESGACATVTAGPIVLATVCAPPHSVAGGESLSINCKEGPVCVPVTCGNYTLHQTFHVSAVSRHCILPCKAASAEFAPDPALDPLWISYWEPFHGALKKDFGFQVVIRVTPGEVPPEQTDSGKKDEGGNGKPENGKSDNGKKEGPGSGAKREEPANLPIPRGN